MRKHGGTPSQRDTFVLSAATSPPVLPGATMMGATSQV